MAKILLAAGSNEELQSIAAALKEINHEVVTAKDGEEAELKARAENMDMIILNIILPKKNGYQVCRTLRSEKNLGEVPIIMVSSKEQENDRDWGIKQGATDYIDNPFTPLDILLAVRKYLKK
jgi:DNA-binding response OmpR family regulator